MATITIEIPKGSRVKYEMDKESGSVRADRIVAFPYPENYGYIEKTLADDNDPLDVFLVSDFSFAPGALVEVEVIGMVEMLDNNEKDHKILAIFKGESPLEYVDTRIKNIRNFLTIYKPNVELGFTSNVKDADSYLEYCKSRYVG